MVSHSDVLYDIKVNNLQKDLYFALNRLYSNPDFKLVFKNYYCNEYVISLVKSLSQYSENTTEYQETIRELSVISSFQKFLQEILTNGAMAIDNLKELNAIPESEIYDE